MSYVIISTEVNLVVGPTLCGDKESDPALMSKLEAEYEFNSGVNYGYFKSKLNPREVLNRLAREGYRVVAMAGAGQTCIWTLLKE